MLRLHVRVVLSLVLAAVAFVAAPGGASGVDLGPSVSWSSPAEGSTVSGNVDLTATSAADPSGTASITKWCLKANGALVTSNVAHDGDIYYASYSNGCWTDSISGDINTGTFRFDTTAWADGPATFSLTVTDSNNRTATSTTLTLTISNGGPSVSWSSPAEGSTVSGNVDLTATSAADPSGTASITKWCLKANGALVTSNVAHDGDIYYASYSNGCWTDSISGDINTGTFRFDTTAWADGPATFSLTVTDSNNRTATSTTLTLTITNPGVAVGAMSIQPGSIVRGETTVFSVPITEPGAGRYVTNAQWCVEGRGCWNGEISAGAARYRFGYPQLPSGPRTVSLTVTDNTGSTVTRSTSVSVVWTQVVGFGGATSAAFGTRPKVVGRVQAGDTPLTGRRVVSLTFKTGTSRWSRPVRLTTATTGRFSFQLPRVKGNVAVRITTVSGAGLLAYTSRTSIRVSPAFRVRVTPAVRYFGRVYGNVQAYYGFSGRCTLYPRFYSYDYGWFRYPNKSTTLRSGVGRFYFDVKGLPGYMYFTVTCGGPGMTSSTVTVRSRVNP